MAMLSEQELEKMAQAVLGPLIVKVLDILAGSSKPVIQVRPGIDGYGWDISLRIDAAEDAGIPHLSQADAEAILHGASDD